MPIAVLLDKELCAHAEQILLVILTQTVKSILVHKILVVLMLNVKIREATGGKDMDTEVQELFASVHQDLMVTHSFDAMTILAQLTPVAPTPIVKHKETELFVDAEKVMRVIHLFNAP